MTGAGAGVAGNGPLKGNISSEHAQAAWVNGKLPRIEPLAVGHMAAGHLPT